MKKTIIRALMLAVAAAFGLMAQAAVCKIGDTEYDTLTEAFGAAHNGQIVTLMADISDLTAGITISAKTNTLDLAGCNINFAPSDPLFKLTNGAGLILTGSGVISAPTYGCYAINLYGNNGEALTVGEDVTIQGYTPVCVGYTTSVGGVSSTINVCGTLIWDQSYGNIINVACAAKNVAIAIYPTAKMLLRGKEDTSGNQISVSSANATGVVDISGGVFSAYNQSTKLYYSTVKLSTQNLSLNITGGYFAAAVTPAAGHVCVSDSSVEGCSYKVRETSESDYYFQNQRTETKYTTYSAAASGAQSGDTLLMLQDFTGIINDTANKSLTIDLQGHKITGSTRAFQFLNGGTLILANGQITGSSQTFLVGYGSLILDSVTATSTGSYCIYLDTDCGIGNRPASVTIRGDSVLSSSAAATVALFGCAAYTAVLNVESGVITNGAGKVAVNASSYQKTEVNITGGTFGAIGTYSVGTWNITGGTFASNPSAYVAPGYVAVANGTTPEAWTVRPFSARVISENGVTTNGYLTLQAAFDAVKDNETIEVLADNAEAITVTNTCAFTLKSNGYTMSETAPSVPEGYRFAKAGDVCTYAAIPYVAQVVSTGKKFETVQAAIAAVAEDGDTVKLLKDIALDNVVNCGAKGFTLDGDSHKITRTATLVGTPYSFFNFGMQGGGGGKTYAVENVTLDGLTDTTYMFRVEGCTMTIDNVTFKDCTGTYITLFTHANAAVLNCRYTGNTASRIIDFNSNADGDGDIYTLAVSNCLFKANTANGSAIVGISEDKSVNVADCTFESNVLNSENNGAPLYFGDSCSTCTGSFFTNNVVNYTTTSGYANRVRAAGAIFTWTYGTPKGTITGNVFVDNSVVKKNENYLACYAKSVYAAGYYAEDDLADNYWDGHEPVFGQKDLTSSDNDAYAEYDKYNVCASSYGTGYARNANNYGVTVTPIAGPVAQIGEMKYATLQAAVDAAEDCDTIVLIADITSDNGVLVDGKSVDFNLNGHTYTVTRGTASTSESGRYAIVYDGYGIAPLRTTGKIYGGTIHCVDVGIYAGDHTDLVIGNVTVVQSRGELTSFFRHAALAASYGSTLTVESGSYTGDIAASIFTTGGVIDIRGGTFEGTDNLFYVYQPSSAESESDSAVTVSGGQFKGAIDVQDDTPYGSFKASITLKGGVYDGAPSAAYVPAGYQVVANADPVCKFTVGVKVDGGGETTATAVAEEQTSSVDDEKLQEIVLDPVVQEGIEQLTEVVGVALTTEAETNTQGIVITPAGIQSVVDNAKNTGSAEFTNALANASVVTVQVDVVVTPLQYVPTNATTKAGVIAFDLKPEATVTVTTTKGQETTALSNKVEVTNEMIDQTRNILVSIYTGFQPEQIVHTSDDGSIIETFGKDGILFQDGVSTITISHFSTATAYEKMYAAYIGTNGYVTVQAALDAAKDGDKIVVTDPDATLPPGYHLEEDDNGNQILVRDTLIEVGWNYVVIDNRFINGLTNKAEVTQGVTLPAAWGVTPDGIVTVTVRRDSATVSQEEIDGAETSWTFGTDDLAPGVYTVEVAWAVGGAHQSVAATYKVNQLTDGSWEFIAIDNTYVGGKEYPATVEQGVNLPAAWGEQPDGIVTITVTGSNKTISDSVDGAELSWTFNTDDLAPGTYVVKAAWTVCGDERSESVTYRVSQLVDGSWEFVVIDNRYAETKTYPAETKQELTLPTAWGITPTGDVTITVKDEDGNVLDTVNVPAATKTWELDTTSLMPGKYTVSVNWTDATGSNAESVKYGIEMLASGECLLDVDNRIKELKRLAQNSENIVLPASWTEVGDMKLTITDPDGVVSTKNFGSGDLSWSWSTLPLMPGSYAISVEYGDSKDDVTYVIEAMAANDVKDAKLDNVYDDGDVRYAKNHSTDFNVKWVGTTNVVLSLDGKTLSAEPDENGMWTWNTNGLGRALYTFTNMVDGTAHEAKFWIDSDLIKAVVDKGLVVSMTVDAYVGMFGPITNYSEQAIAAPLMVMTNNSLKVWQNYVAGLDGMIPLTPGCLPANVGSAVVTVVTPYGFSQIVPPADSGVTVDYQLIRSATTNFTDAAVFATTNAPVFKVDTSDIDAQSYWKIRAVFSGTKK